MRNPQGLRVPIHLGRGAAEALPDQLAGQLRQAIDSGQLAAGIRMPSTRTMAVALKISRGVALTAYQILHSEGYVTSRHGSGTYVAARTRQAERAPLRPPARPNVVDMRPDQPTADAFPLAEWRAAWRRASHRVPSAAEPPPGGLPELRAAIAAHLRDTRGLVLDRHEIVVTTGCETALQLAVPEGRSVVGIEDPALPRLREALAGHRGHVVPVPVSSTGPQVPAGVDALVLTPDRNEPLGYRLPTEHRRALAAWAADRGTYLIEPAFDGLFNASLNPCPSLLALGDPEMTIMFGSFRELLTPGMRLAYLVVPRHLADGMRERACAVPETCQRAASDLLSTGAVTRRVDRLSAIFARRRTMVRQALTGVRRDTKVIGTETGATATLLLPRALPAPALAEQLRARGVRVATLAAFHHRGGRAGNGVVFGFGHIEEADLRRALRIMVRALSS
ncbi:hypothetical protein Hesp01_48450 [Herbidospora sp. NBRC 101105]|nr:hypothetical protein Hesp01_48450 [Herbidospora sp. NBRC 101105]